MARNHNRKHLRTRYPDPRAACRYLIQKYGYAEAFRYARDRESNWGPNAEWYARVVNVMAEVNAELIAANQPKES